MLLGLAIGFTVVLTTSSGLRTVRGGRIGGDLPAFYGAARIVASGNPGRLYDPLTQERSQSDLFPDGTRGRLPFPYPPFVALAYVPLTWLPFKVAYAAHAAFMALCILGALVALRPALPAINTAWLPAVAATLTFYPLFRAVLGGQNTPFSLLCAACAATALSRKRDFAAGLWLGAWLYKPPLALVVAAVVLLRVSDRRRFLLGFALVAVPYYLIGVAVGGWGWPLWWWQEGAVPFAVADLAVDRGNGISFAELAAEAGLTPFNWILAALTVGFALWIARQQRVPAVAVTAFAAGAAVLVGPHVLFYDAGLAALALIASATLRPSTLPYVIGIWVLAWLQPMRPLLPLPPLTAVVVLSMWLAGVLRSPSAKTSG